MYIKMATKARPMRAEMAITTSFWVRVQHAHAEQGATRMILVPEDGEPGGAGVGVAAEGVVDIVRVEGAVEEVGRMGAWREGVVVAADDAMIGRLYGCWGFFI